MSRATAPMPALPRCGESAAAPVAGLALLGWSAMVLGGAGLWALGFALIT